MIVGLCSVHLHQTTNCTDVCCKLADSQLHVFCLCMSECSHAVLKFTLRLSEFTVTYTSLTSLNICWHNLICLVFVKFLTYQNKELSVSRSGHFEFDQLNRDHLLILIVSFSSIQSVLKSLSHRLRPRTKFTRVCA